MGGPPELLLFLRLVLAGAMFALASIMDLRSREVRDVFWIPFASAGLALSILQAIRSSQTQSLIQVYLVSAALAALIGFVPYHLKLFGGADAIALMVAGILLPTYDSEFSIVREGSSIHNFASVMILTNATFLALGLPVFFLIKNTVSLARGYHIFEGFESEPRSRRLAAFLLGYRSRSAGRFLFRMERRDASGRRFELGPHTHVNFVKEEDVWVTPGIPLVVFMLAGFLVMVFLGDILALVLRAVLL